MEVDVELENSQSSRTDGWVGDSFILNILLGTVRGLADSRPWSVHWKAIGMRWGRKEVVF